MRPGGLSRTARQALGYRELLAYVEKGGDLTEAVVEAVRRTGQFARRQRMWWRRDPRVRWFGAAGKPHGNTAVTTGRLETMTEVYERSGRGERQGG